MLHAQKQSVPPLTLGEGPVWHPLRKTLFFVDIDGRMIYGVREDCGIRHALSMPDRVGFVVPWGNHLLAGAGTTLCAVHIDDGCVKPVLSLPYSPDVRLNDGKCDPSGRLFAGVMAWDRSRADTAGLGALFAVDSRGVFQKLAPMDIPNGMAWDDAGHFYHTDTATGCIDRYDCMPDGTIAGRQRAVAVCEGSPDGLCIDSEGMLWVALWGAGRVQRFDPRTGSALPESIGVEEKNVSCCCFGGEDMRTLYITTASGPGETGALYACRTDVRGLPPHAWQGRLPWTDD